MANLKRPIGEIVPENQTMTTANESDSMAEIANRMEYDESLEYLSQIPLRDTAGKIRSVITGKGLARWGGRGRPNDQASDFSETGHRFLVNEPLEKITDTVANFGYVLVTNEDDDVVGILSYTEVIRELTR